jgi:hypothetical protein
MPLPIDILADFQHTSNPVPVVIQLIRYAMIEKETPALQLHTWAEGWQPLSYRRKFHENSRNLNR